MSIDQAVITLPPRPGPEITPLTEILGLPLVHRVVLAAAQSGVRDFFLIGASGKETEEIAVFLRKDPRISGQSLSISSVPSPGPGKPAGGTGIHGRFWLIPADAVFDPDILVRAAEEDPGGAVNLHLVDSAPMTGPETAETIRVKAGPSGQEGLTFVAGPAEGSSAYAAVSLCAADIFPRLGALFVEAGPRRTPAGILNDVFGNAPARTFDTAGRFCFRVLSKAALKKARRSLLATARKPTDSFVSRTFNRPISLFLTRPLIWLGIKPNPLSVVCLAIGMASCWFIAQGGYAHSVLGAFLFEFASIFDGCDGEVARLTYRTSKFGGFVDMVGDAVIFVLFFVCLPVGLYRGSHRPIWLVLGVLALLSMGTFYLQLTAFMKKKKLGNYVVGLVKDIEQTAGRPGFGGRLDRMAAKIAFIYRRDFFSMGAFIVIAVGGAAVLMWVLGVLIPLQPIYVHFFSKRRFSSIPSPE
jgi:1L-myo-inositol 1-phosphate cytidylyltransferase / CDP-L-myo-inositol myo-inositolphosphotransferase